MNAYGDFAIHHFLLMEKVWKMADEFDIVHSHLDYYTFPSLRQQRIPCISTLHGRLDLPSYQALFREFSEHPLVSISDSQREPLSFANFSATIHHGMPADLCTFSLQPENYALFLGRICPEKGADKAIEIATRAGIPLKIAAKVDPLDEQYFQSVIKPLLDRPGVEFLGEATQDQKDNLIGKAKALLFPITWPEPFGLVMIEAMACGTPVIAFDCGSVPEVMEHGKSGYVCSTVDQAVEYLASIDSFDRLKCREVFDRRFTAELMAKEYLKVYESVIAASASKHLLSFSRFHKDVNVSATHATAKRVRLS
jgi:glycosyltransferase involved in cell wall biosynthesis